MYVFWLLSFVALFVLGYFLRWAIRATTENQNQIDMKASELGYYEKFYLDGVVWKRNVHKKHGTTLLQSYSYWYEEGVMIQNLRNLLESNGIKLSRRDIVLLFVFHLDSYENISHMVQTIDTIAYQWNLH